MSFGKGGPDIYQSPYYQAADTLAYEQLLGMTSGQPITPSPALNAQLLAQGRGGHYDARSGNVTFPDGGVVKFDPATGAFVAGNNSAQSNAAVASSNQYLTEKIAPVYGEDSPYSLMGQRTFGDLEYDPETGRMVSGSEKPQGMTGDYYMQKYGDYLNTPYEQSEYDPFNYQAASPYEQYNYENFTIPGVDNISQELVDKQITRAQDQVNRDAKQQRMALQGFLGRAGSDVGSGRAYLMEQDISNEQARKNQMASDELNTQHALRSFYDAQNVRDMQAAQALTVQDRRAGEARYSQDKASEESRFGQNVAREEKQKSFDVGREEKQKAFDIGQQQGERRMGLASAADSDAYGRAFQQTQANRQQALQRVQAFQDMLRIYAGQDATAGQLEAQQAGGLTSALGGMFKTGADIYIGK